MDILIRDATIITQDRQRRILKGDILVRNNRIAGLGKKGGDKAEFTIDARNKLAIPGLINMHAHMAMSLFRGYGEGLPLERWLEEKVWPMEAKETPADAFIATQLALLEAIRSGTTAFNDMCIMGAKEIAKASDKAGVRSHVCQGILDLLPGRALDTELKTMERCAYPPGKLSSFGVAPHSAYTCSEELLIKAKEFATRRKLRIHTHAAETRKEVFDVQKKTGKRVMEYLDGLGLVGESSIFAHCGWVTKKEISTAGKKRLNVVHCPVSNLKLATGGICPITEFDREGANVCIGTDSAASNNSLNMLESVKMAALLQKHRYWKADILGAQRVLDFATLNGARALGVDCGRIEEGALADIVLLEKGPNMVPSHDIVSNVVYAANPSNVSDVIIDGRLVMENKEIKTMDEAAVIQEAEELAKEMEKR